MTSQCNLITATIWLCLLPVSRCHRGKNVELESDLCLNLQATWPTDSKWTGLPWYISPYWPKRHISSHWILVFSFFFYFYLQYSIYTFSTDVEAMKKKNMSKSAMTISYKQMRVMLDGRYYFHCLPLRYLCKINELHGGNQQWVWDIFDDRTEKVEQENNVSFFNCFIIMRPRDTKSKPKHIVTLGKKPGHLEIHVGFGGVTIIQHKDACPVRSV